MHSPSWAILLAIALMAWNPSLSIAEEPPLGTSPDCGVNALYVLLHLHGRSVNVDRLQKVLGSRDPEGYSMAELSEASQSLGLPLEGVRFESGDPPLDQAAIAYFQDGHNGHFAVLQPVGFTGTMVQVIDPPWAPRIVDYGRLFTDTPWAGRILLPIDPWINRKPMVFTTIVGLILALALALLGFRRSMRYRGLLEPTTRSD